MIEAFVLPFYRSYSQISYNHPALSAYFGRMFKMYTKNTELLPFMCALPDSFSGGFQIIIREWPTGKVAYRVGPNQINHSIIKYKDKRYLLFKGGRVDCINLQNCTAYFLEIEGLFSEVFYAKNDVKTLSLFRFENSKNIGSIPYTLFSQYVYLDTGIPNPEYRNFTISKTDERGETSISLAKIQAYLNFDFYQVPIFFQAVLYSIPLLEKITVSNIYSTVVLDSTTFEISINERFDYFSDLKFTLKQFEEVESSACSEELFTLDTQYEGNSNADICPDETPILGVTTSCDIPILGVTTSCDIPEFDFIAVIVK